MECEEYSLLARLSDITVERNIPFNVMFELTHRCNTRCKHCYQHHPRRADGELTTEEWYRVMDDLAAAGTLYLTLTGGEPLLRKDFFDIARYARKKRFALKIYTNGTLVTPTVAERIASLRPFTVEISVYGSNAETHDGMTQVKGSFDRVLRAVRLLVGLGQRVILKCPLATSSFGQYEDIMQMAQQLGAEYRFDPTIAPMNDGNMCPTNLRIGTDELMKLYDDERVFKKKGLPSMGPDDRVKMCDAGRNSMAINPWGEVYPCVQMLVPCGNVREKSVLEIWYGSRELRSLRSITPDDLTQCQTCEVKQYCSRCPGQALLEDGSLTGCHSRAKVIARIRKRLAEQQQQATGANPLLRVVA
jgi:radical SAM protein with 4Fe4S-binding SPASM domain